MTELKGSHRTMTASVASETLTVAAAPWVASLYFAEGLPYAIIRVVAAQYFTEMGASLPAIGRTSLYGLAWNLKLFWSPFVDRYGSMRAWILATESAVGATLAIAALAADSRSLGASAALFGMGAVLAATHDVAIDGYYLGVLDKGTQTRLSGLRIAAYRAALFAGHGLVMLGSGLGWRTCFLTGAASLLSVAVIHRQVLPAQVRALGPDVPYLEAFRSFSRQTGALSSLLFIIVYHAGDALMFAMSPPLYRSLGWNAGWRGTIGLVGTAASVVGSMGGGLLISRCGLRRTLSPIAIVQSLAILLYVGLSVGRPTPAAVIGAAVVEQLVTGVGGAAFVVFLLRRCSLEHKAAHFAMGTALMSVAATVAGFASGYLAKRVGFPAFFTLAFLASLPGALLSFVVPKD
jgi:PAT family beta-lactamase induction signal transducer AmpG